MPAAITKALHEAKAAATEAKADKSSAPSQRSGGASVYDADSAPLIGRVVRVSGLAGRADLNGLRAIAFSFADGRYGVRVHRSGECVRLKSGNLTLAGAGGDEDDDDGPHIVEVD